MVFHFAWLYFKQMQTFNVLCEIYGEKKAHNVFKITNI